MKMPDSQSGTEDAAELMENEEIRGWLLRTNFADISLLMAFTLLVHHAATKQWSILLRCCENISTWRVFARRHDFTRCCPGAAPAEPLPPGEPITLAIVKTAARRS